MISNRQWAVTVENETIIIAADFYQLHDTGALLFYEHFFDRDTNLPGYRETCPPLLIRAYNAKVWTSFSSYVNEPKEQTNETP